MSTVNDARLNFRITGELKKTIEEAAARMGQTVTDFAISILIQASRRVLQDDMATHVSERDRQRFVAIIDNESSEPAAALVKAARRYRKQVR